MDGQSPSGPGGRRDGEGRHPSEPDRNPASTPGSGSYRQRAAVRGEDQASGHSKATSPRTPTSATETAAREYLRRKGAHAPAPGDAGHAVAVFHDGDGRVVEVFGLFPSPASADDWARAEQAGAYQVAPFRLAVNHRPRR